MKELEKKELEKINGGGISIGLIVVVTAGISFLAGLLDGIARPSKCNK